MLGAWVTVKPGVSAPVTSSHRPYAVFIEGTKAMELKNSDGVAGALAMPTNAEHVGAGSVRNSSAVSISVRPHSAHGDEANTTMPTHGPLIDRYGRVHTDMRISVTDRCNLRCVYCMAEEGMTFLPRSELLSFEEIARIARVARDLGVTSIRLTGGEPLVRKGVTSLVQMLSDIGFEDLALTTNAMLLAGLASPLADAGLSRVNVSCDSLRPDRFAAIRRRGDLSTVLAAMDAAEAAGLRPLKVNVVLMRGTNDDEILDFAAFARATGRIVRFIEFMPLDAEGNWGRERLVAGKDVYAAINAVWPLDAVGGSAPAPAERFGFRDGEGEIGLISSVTQPFCGTCNRLRLMADGAMRNCLFSDDEHVVRDLMRQGAPDEDLAMVLRRAAWAKFPGHAINEPEFLHPARSMSMIGG
jgi:cyclic pyranopterin phosphate synthase